VLSVVASCWHALNPYAIVDVNVKTSFLGQIQEQSRSSIIKY
jgi:hypothetical protein